MEPRLLSNNNGTLSAFSTPQRSFSANHSFKVPTTVIGINGDKYSNSAHDTPNTLKIPRRQSTQWVRSPASDECNNENAANQDETLILSPVPATPAPEAVSAYAEALLDGGSEQTPYFMKREMLVQRTAPPKERNREADELAQSGDAQVEKNGHESRRWRWNDGILID